MLVIQQATASGQDRANKRGRAMWLCDADSEAGPHTFEPEPEPEPEPERHLSLSVQILESCRATELTDASVVAQIGLGLGLGLGLEVRWWLEADEVSDPLRPSV